MAAPKITHGQIAHPATSIIAPPPAHLPPPSYEEISNSRPPPAYVDPNPNTSPAPHVNQARAVLTQEPPQEQPYPHWVRRNLSIATFTVFFMILVAIPHLIFACIVAKDLHDDEFDHKCGRYYISSADEPPQNEHWTVPTPGIFHADCRLLYHWSQLLTAAGSTTILRALLQAIPVQRSSSSSTTSTSTRRRSRIARSLFSPSGVWTLRTLASLSLFALYLASALILCTNRFITGPQARDSLRPVYLGSAGLIWFSVLLTGHQAATTGIASWCARGIKDPNERSYTPSI
ncbi:unnamed protein product [Clonostachys rosea f. rosea IK726]|uniref:Uncharacterized protein n=1 Tax=Clonostachys rosea f. rosea IK726 TaxID=1349383 RepID=A0ACA9U260_BIOOC|nr:unnamed protein product [Clonostachys rosea f. rosea IK726]